VLVANAGARHSSIHDVKAIVLGTNAVRFKAEIRVDAVALVAKYLEMNEEVESLRTCACATRRAVRRGASNCACWADLLRQTSPDSIRRFLEHYTEDIMAFLGGEIDRIEWLIKSTLPEIRHVDLELV
jgi:hypothetical protein